MDGPLIPDQDLAGPLTGFCELRCSNCGELFREDEPHMYFSPSGLKFCRSCMECSYWGDDPFTLEA